MGNFFILFFILAAISWVIGIIESIGIHLMIRPFYFFGIPVYRESFDFNEDLGEIPNCTTIKGKQGKYKFKNDRVYFIWSSWSFKTPFTIRARGKIIDNSKVRVTGTIGVGPTMFLLSWVGGWTTATFGSTQISEDYTIILIGLAGIMFPLMLLLANRAISIDRIQKLNVEIKEIITAYNKK